MTKRRKFPTANQSHDLQSVCMIRFHLVEPRTIHNANFVPPILSNDEMTTGCRLGFDTWADTTCSGRHAHVVSFVDNKIVNAEGFASNLGSLRNLSIANVAYAFDMPSGETIILRLNNTIYMGEHMNDCLANPIQLLEGDTRIDLRPRKFYPQDNETQTITFPN